MSGWIRPRRWPSRRTGFLFTRDSKTTCRLALRKSPLKPMCLTRSTASPRRMLIAKSFLPTASRWAASNERDWCRPDQRDRQTWNQKLLRRCCGRRNRRSSTSSSPPFPWTAKLLTKRKRASASAPSAFDPDKGFLLNGKHYWIYGVCNHQDHAGVGAAIPGCAAGISHQQIEGVRLQRHSHFAQSAHAGVARRLRPARHVGHGREPVARQRFGELEKVGRHDPPRPQSSERRHLEHRERGVHRAGLAAGRERRAHDAKLRQATRPDAAR